MSFLCWDIAFSMVHLLVRGLGHGEPCDWARHNLGDPDSISSEFPDVLPVSCLWEKLEFLTDVSILSYEAFECCPVKYCESAATLNWLDDWTLLSYLGYSEQLWLVRHRNNNTPAYYRSLILYMTRPFTNDDRSKLIYKDSKVDTDKRIEVEDKNYI